MAHEVESIAYTSCEENGWFKPWHGLGQPVREFMTSAEALTAAGLDWNVINKPVFVEGKQIPGYVANVRDIDGSVLGIVSPKYKIVQNKVAFDFTDNLIGDEVRYETAGSLKGGRTIFLTAQLPKSKILDDDFENYIVFCNTHDGTGAIKVCTSSIRVVCNNTLNVALNSAKRSWSTRHMGDMQSKVWEAQHTLQLANKYTEELSKFAEKAVEYKIDEEKTFDIISQLFPSNTEDSDRKQANAKKSREEFTSFIYTVDLRPYVGTAWGLINAAAAFAAHRVPQRNTSTYRENNMEKIINGHPILDFVTSAIGVI